MTTVYHSGLIIRYQEYNGPGSQWKIDKQDKSPEEKALAKKRSAKRHIENSMAYLQDHSINRPLLFVLTCPGGIDWHQNMTEKPVSKFFRNCTTNFGLNYYVWVREFTKSGLPHWHVCADMPFRDIQKLSKYWSALWDSDSKSSIRMHKREKRFLNGAAGWLYFTKYITKEIEDNATREIGRFFAISQKLRDHSKPITLPTHKTRHLDPLYNLHTIKDYPVTFGTPKGNNRSEALKLIAG